jgi:hypothetical protein
MNVTPLQAGATGDVTGPTSAVSGHVATFADNTGKKLADGGALGAIAPLGIGTGLESSSSNLRLAAIANNKVLANISGSSSPPSASDLSAIIDSAVGSTRGAILERGSSGWTLLTPGTQGYALVSNGPGADPGYAAIGGTLTSSGLNAGALPAGWVSGRKYAPGMPASGAGASIGTGTLYGVFVFIPNLITLKTISCYTQGSSTTVRMGLYNISSTDNTPTTLVSGTDIGTVATGSSAGPATATLGGGGGVAIGAGWYAIAFTCGASIVAVTLLDAIPTRNALLGNSSLNDVLVSRYPPVGFKASFTYGALPTNFPTPLADINATINCPHLVLGL